MYLISSENKLQIFGNNGPGKYLDARISNCEASHEKISDFYRSIRIL